MQQPNLFELDAYGGANARSTDPPSSHEAAAKMRESGKLSRHCEIVLALVRANPGRTYAEIYGTATAEQQRELHEAVAVARRLPDLEKVGLVRKGEARLCGVKGNRMVTWWAN